MKLDDPLTFEARKADGNGSTVRIRAVRIGCRTKVLLIDPGAVELRVSTSSLGSAW